MLSYNRTAFCLIFLVLFITGSNFVYAERGIKVRLRAHNSADSPVSEEIVLYENSYVFVIGINDYTHGWPKLSKAVSDANRVADVMEKAGFNVTLITNPDSGEMTRAFQEFFIFKGEKKQDRLFVWFAGHGYTEDGEGYIIPKDAPRPHAGASFRYKALSMRRFGEYVRQAKSKHALAVFDSCFSGTIFSTQRSAPPVAITRISVLPVRQFLSSGDADQTVSDNGLFCKLFIRSLTGEENADANNDGYLTGSELGMFMTDRITNLSEATQTPRYGKLRDPDFDRGDFVFTLPSSPNNPVKNHRVVQVKQSGKSINPEAEMWETVKNSGNPEELKAFIKSFPDSRLVPSAKIKLARLKKDASGVTLSEVYIKTLKKYYRKGESVVVEYANLPGNDGDWFTVVKKDKPDTSYGQYDYTYGNKNGRYTFKNLEPGEYEVRLYLDWPKGNYEVRYRYPFTVKK